MLANEKRGIQFTQLNTEMAVATISNKGPFVSKRIN